MKMPVSRTSFLRLSLCLALLVTVNSNARSATPLTDEVGITFFKGSWKELLAEAKRQNKLVFVDIYTTWCGPCKLMAKQAFPNAKVGERYNAIFVNYQIDAEKGEGIDIAKKYAATAFPTSLYVSASGDLIHRAIGYNGIKGMIDEVNKAIAAVNYPNPLLASEKQYKTGKSDVNFLADHLQNRAKVGMPDGEALEDYLKVLPKDEWSSDKTLELVTANLTSPKSQAFDFLLQQIPIMSKSDKMPVRRMASKALIQMFLVANSTFKEAVAAKNEILLEESIRSKQQIYGILKNRGVDSPSPEELASQQRIEFYLHTKNTDKYRTLMQVEGNKLMTLSVDSVKIKNEVNYQKFLTQKNSVPDSIKNSDYFRKVAQQMKTFETDQIANKLNTLALAYYENMVDNNDINQALNWSEKSLEYDRAAVNLNTYAHLLSKLGHKIEAIKAQEEAIAKLKAAGQDVVDYEKSLAEIKNK